MSDQANTKSERLRQERFEAHVERHHGYNFVMMVAEGSLFIAAMVLYSGVTVLSGFLTRLHAGTVMVGLTVGAFIFTWTGVQLLAAFRQGHLPLKRRTIMILRLLGGFTWVGFAAVLFFFYRPGPLWDRIASWSLIATVVCFAALCGYSVPLWMDFVGKIFREDSRGRYYGWRNGLGAAIGLGVSTLVLAPLLKYAEFPNGYAWAFLLAGVFVAAGALCLGRSREVPPPRPRGPERLGDFLRGLLSTWRGSRPFKFFVITAALGAFGGVGVGGCMATPFFMRKAICEMGADDFYVGVATAVLVSGQVVSAALAGVLVDRVSAKLVNFLNMCTSILACLAGLLITGEAGRWPFLAAFFLVGASRGLLSTAYHNCVLESVPVSQRPQGIGLANFVRSPFMLLAPYIGGVLLARAGVGYPGLFLIALVSSVANALLWLFGAGLKRTPLPEEASGHAAGGVEPGAVARSRR
jgi:MFS family permease